MADHQCFQRLKPATKTIDRTKAWFLIIIVTHGVFEMKLHMVGERGVPINEDAAKTHAIPMGIVEASRTYSQCAVSAHISHDLFHFRKLRLVS